MKPTQKEIYDCAVKRGKITKQTTRKQFLEAIASELLELSQNKYLEDEFKYAERYWDEDSVLKISSSPILAAGWISVKEKLPQHENNVLAVLDGQVCIMNYFSFQENGETNKVWGYVYDGINGDGIFDDNYYPTHWMEIPCPPRRRKNSNVFCK